MDTTKFFTELDRCYAEKRIAEAEIYMKSCLAQAEAGNDPTGIVTVCNELGGYYRTLSRYDEGTPLYEKALNIIGALGQNRTPAHGTTLINYATNCTMNGQQEKALELYGKAAEIFSGPGYTPDFNLATLYNNMSLVCQSMNNFSQAEDYLKRALRILETLQDSRIEIAITYTNLANICSATERFSEAKDLLEQAIDIFLRESDGQDIHYAAAINALGEVYFCQGDYASAARQFEEALKLNIRDLGEDTDSCRTIKKNLELCRQRLGEEAPSC